MALLWERRVGDTCYQVRSAGASRRLYTDGIFHSQYNPRRPLSGGVWDLLLLPAFFQPQQVRRVLVLGVGGGAVIRLLREFLAPETIIGIDLDGTHLAIAREFFGVEGEGTTLVQADAERWLADYRGAPFDLIIEDLFGGADGEPVRALKANARWFDRLRRPLARDGILAMNFPTSGQLAGCAALTNRRVQARFAAGFALSGFRDTNAVGVFLRRPADSFTLRRHLNAHPGLDPRKASGVRYRIRQLF